MEGRVKHAADRRVLVAAIYALFELSQCIQASARCCPVTGFPLAAEQKPDLYYLLTTADPKKLYEAMRRAGKSRQRGGVARPQGAGGTPSPSCHHLDQDDQV